jgi:hypothetical protein
MAAFKADDDAAGAPLSRGELFASEGAGDCAVSAAGDFISSPAAEAFCIVGRSAQGAFVFRRVGQARRRGRIVFGKVVSGRRGM